MWAWASRPAEQHDRPSRTKAKYGAAWTMDDWPRGLRIKHACSDCDVTCVKLIRYKRNSGMWMNDSSCPENRYHEVTKKTHYVWFVLSLEDSSLLWCYTLSAGKQLRTFRQIIIIIIIIIIMYLTANGLSPGGNGYNHVRKYGIRI